LAIPWRTVPPVVANTVHRPPRRSARAGAGTAGSLGASPQVRSTPLLAFLQHFVTSVIGDHGLTAIFLLMLLESACVPFPSEVTMLFGGALTTAAFAGAGNELGFWPVVLAGTLGNLAGSWLAYWAGSAGGRPLVDRYGRYLLVRPHEVDKAHAWFERHGEAAVFVSRLLPVIRTFISLPAGIARMGFGRFTLYTVLGCLPWCLALTWLGAELGGRWSTVEDVLRPLAWVIGIAIVAGLAVLIRGRWRVVRREYAALDAAAAAARGAAQPDPDG
jgi:membrane protein DedA with SNARE-associated domain